MRLSDFDYDLPEALIALRPARPRSASRLLVATPRTITDSHVRDLGLFLRPGDLLVMNDTRVIPARLAGTRRRDSRHGSGVAAIEVTLISHTDAGWQALARPARRLAPGDVIDFGALSAEVVAKKDGGVVTLAFDREGRALDTALEAAGEMPLPPYIASRRAADLQDRDDYQTVFAARTGAVAAPTAALHFDQPLLERLEAAGVRRTTVTLHVGAGTFLPVKSEDVSQHRMHAEWGEIGADAAAEVERTLAAGGRVIPVGTTALRLLESAATAPGRIGPWSGETDIFITPGFGFRIASGLMTNFHLPKSTLLMLVSALMGRERIMAIYRHAVERRYRFFSYGDSSLLLPKD